MNRIHGCTSCSFPGCHSGSCPICHPSEHNHHRIKNRDYYLGIGPRPSNPNCGYTSGFATVHAFQETETSFICRICGKIVKKPDAPKPAPYQPPYKSPYSITPCPMTGDGKHMYPIGFDRVCAYCGFKPDDRSDKYEEEKR